MAKNLKDYTKAELINIAEQLTIPKAGLATSKNSTLITEIEDMAEELGVAIPEPEIELNTPVKTVEDGKPQRRRIKDYPRVKIVLEGRSPDIKQQYVSINEYTASIKVGEEVMIPEPVADYLDSLKDVIHVANEDGTVSPKSISRFYVRKQ